MISIELTKDEAEIICDFIEDEQNSGIYEGYWSKDQRGVLDEVLFKVKVALKKARCYE